MSEHKVIQRFIRPGQSFEDEQWSDRGFLLVNKLLKNNPAPIVGTARNLQFAVADDSANLVKRNRLSIDDDGDLTSKMLLR